MSPATSTDVDLTTTLAGITLANPVMTASGCGGRELAPFSDLAGIGAVVSRSVLLEARSGNLTPRLVSTPSGILSSVGLQGPGIDGFLATELPWLAQRRVRTVVSVAGTSLAEFGELARRVGNSPGVSAVEVNLACAGRGHDGRSFGSDPYQTGKVLSVVRRDVPRGIPVLAKLSPDADRVVDVASAAVEAGADGLVLVNPPMGLSFDPATLRPALGGTTGGLSGPAIRPLALRCVWEVHQALPGVPIVGVGGIRTGFDALEFLLAGAAAVQVGSITFHDPSAPSRIISELGDELAGRGIERVADVIGRGHRPEGQAL